MGGEGLRQAAVGTPVRGETGGETREPEEDAGQHGERNRE